MGLHVAVFDDVLFARGEVFEIPGLAIRVFAHADDIVAICTGEQGDVPDVLCMDYSMGRGHANGDDAVRAARSAGYRGKIIAISSDPVARERLLEAGADEALPQKAVLRSYLVALGKKAGAGADS